MRDPHRHENDGNIADVWTDELRGRVEEIDSVEVDFLSLEEVKRRMADRRAKRRAQEP